MVLHHERPAGPPRPRKRIYQYDKPLGPLVPFQYDKPLGPPRPRGRKPVIRHALSECHLNYGWNVVWEGTEGSCLAVKKRIDDGEYPHPSGALIDTIKARTKAGHYIVIWRLRRAERNGTAGTEDHVPGSPR